MNNSGIKKSRIIRDSQEKLLEIIAGICLILGVLIIVLYWSEIPEQIPSHFGADGIPDRWSGKSTIIFLPIVSFFLYALLSSIGWFAGSLNYKGDQSELKVRTNIMSRKMLVWLKLEIVVLFTYLIWQTIRVAQGFASGIGSWFLPAVLIVIFGTAGWHVYKISRGTKAYNT
jgi:uncharacterized membrane protein